MDTPRRITRCLSHHVRICACTVRLTKTLGRTQEAEDTIHEKQEAKKGGEGKGRSMVEDDENRTTVQRQYDQAVERRDRYLPRLRTSRPNMV